MKVLFAVNNESISEAIIKKYQQDYKEIISSKNVYYFDAITKELQKDKSYDRVVISEDVEPFANNNYGVIDKFIFERLDAISDEATSNNGQDIPIILICADRRTKSESILVKLFGIGIYSALLGEDRTISKVCELINKPRSKKDAKIYYRIDSEEVDYKAESESDVSEEEIQNILHHYKKLGKNEEEYVKSFDNIAEQYTDEQLRVICKFLPISVKAVLEANSEKYQEIVTFGGITANQSKGKDKNQKYIPNKEYENAKNKKEHATDILEKNIGNSELTKPVIIPSVSNISTINENKTNDSENITTSNEKEKFDKNDIENILQSVENNIKNQDEQEEQVKKKRGRPKKLQEENDVEQPKRKRGRPKKIQESEENNIEEKEEVNLFDLGIENSEQKEGEIILPGLSENTELNNTESISTNEEKVESLNLFELEKNVENNQINNADLNNEIRNNNFETQSITQNVSQNVSNFDNLLSMQNKIVAFVGTSKNGTSFLVNNMADLLSKKGIKTAILDLTQNKNAYYIYTQNDEELRKKAFSCIENLKNGVNNGIDINKNLTVFTTLPNQNDSFDNVTNILNTLINNYSLILLDCDFETNYEYFKYAKEIYLVQSFDILTIQPLTAFLRNLKLKEVLDSNKLRIVLNKVLRVRSVTERLIIGGMSSYNDPAMSYMTELFDKDNIKYCPIPFEQEVYSKYLEGLVNCEISTKGYPKNFMLSLEKLGNMIYPLLNNDKKSNNKFNAYVQSNTSFSNNMNETLKRMKNKY